MPERSHAFVKAACLLVIPLATLLAQADRVTGRIDPQRTVALKGNLNPRAKLESDRGPVDSSLKLPAITLILRPSSAQQAAIEQLLNDQRDPASPDYRNWLTPEQYADRFGLSPGDIAKIVAWLQADGFKVEQVARARQWIQFSGTAGQVESAFHTAIHRYQVEGELHFANAAEPSIPAALEPAVLVIHGLDDFREKPQNVKKQRVRPRTSGNEGNHDLSPGDLATIYDIAPLYNRGIDGTGQKIVVAGQTDVDLNDVAYFRQYFGLPPNNPQVVVYGTDPGTVQSEMDEANLDLDWAGAIAPGATVIYVIAQYVSDAAMYAVDHNLAPVISYSYGLCEPQDGASLAIARQQIAQQANLQGITWIAASGDAGAAACDSGASAVNGFAVQLPASIPEVTGVGGTVFNEGSGTYWGTNGSALKWIPEMAWNDTTERGSLSASGGGASIFFSKPSWQAGPGVPSDDARDVPDVALTASPDHDGYYIAINGGLDPYAEGGTSAATPVFAGIVVLLNQYLVSTGAQSQPGLQNINPTLYRLAQGTSGLFHDVTAGNNIVPCTQGTPNCTTGQFGYNAGPGYDQVTGLGSVDAYNLVTGWATPTSSATSTTVAANPATIAPTASTVVTAAVKASSGSTSPGGIVTFAAGSTTLGTAQLSGSGGSSTASLTVSGSQLEWNNVVTATYNGGTVFSSSSGTVTVGILSVTPGSHVLVSVSPNPVYQQAANANGYQWFYTVTLTETAGVSTTVTGFTWNGIDYSSDIANWFGSTTLAANGTLSANLEAKDLTVPANIVFAFTGQDSQSWTPWTAQITVPFLGPQVTQGYVITTVAGNGTQGYSGDGGPATHAELKNPAGVAVDTIGNLYIADISVIRKVASDGTITTVAGSGKTGYSGDGGPAISAELNSPEGVAVDGAGNLYVADSDNFVVREVNPSGTIATVAGNGISCIFPGLGATSASLCYPVGVAVDNNGNLYIADSDGNRIRKVAPGGIMTTVAGNGAPGYSGDGGPATSARLSDPWGVAADAAGDLYIADSGNSVIRKVSPDGMITTVAGNGSAGYSGDGGPATNAQLFEAAGVAVDPSGSLYIADTSNNRIRKVTPDGTIATIAGNGTAGYSGDAGPATSAQLEGPYFLTVDMRGRVYLPDQFHGVVRMLTPQASGAGSAALTIAKSHQGNFSSRGGTYTIVVGNAAGAAPTSGTVTVTDNGITQTPAPTIPQIVVYGMSGVGWSCSGVTCTRSDALNAGSSYPPITFTVEEDFSGAHSLTNQATVSGGGSASATASDVTQFAASAVVVTAGPLPAGIVGGSYSTTLSATGGVAPYKWTLALIGTSLPNGLALDPSGVISGIPTAAGSFSFNINANDSTGAWSSGTFQLTIDPAPSSVLSRTGICAQIASGGSWTTTLTVVNVDTVPIQVKVNFWGDDGQALTLPLTFPQQGGGSPANASFVERSLAVGGSLIIQSTGSGGSSTAQGWAEILATGHSGGFAIFRDLVNGQLTQEGTSPVDSHNQSTFMLPFDNTAGFVTSMAIVNNSSTQQAGVTATILDENGVVLAQQQPISALPVNGHTAFALPQEFTATAGRRGVVQFQSMSGGGITALGLRFSPTSSFTSIPVMYP
jgi:hypothetical protein